MLSLHTGRDKTEQIERSESVCRLIADSQGAKQVSLEMRKKK